jgi:ribosomal protein S18 acetylase RimI-like enzyme
MYADIRLRPTLPADRPFCLSLFSLVRADELQAGHWEATARDHVMAMQFAAHEAHLLQAGKADDCMIVMGTWPDAPPIGRIVVFHRESEIHVADLSLLPEFRQRGIGTHLLTGLQGEARACGLPLRLYCLRTNPAAGLYRKLGFRDDGHGKGAHILLTWSPDAAG